MPRPRLQRAATARREKVQLRIREQSFQTSYGSSAVTRTSGRGHVAEAKTNVIEVSGFSPLMSTFVFSFQHKDAEYRSLVVWMPWTGDYIPRLTSYG